MGRATLLKLVAKCDVVIENYRADVLDNLGLGYEVLKAAKPDIILVSMAGYGKTGPEREQVGFGPIIEQMRSGLASLSVYGDDGVPMKTGLSYGDPVAGMAAASAVALALIQRRKTGEGAFIDLGQREVLSTFIGEAFVAASLRGEEPVQRGNRDARYFAQGVYRCAGVEQWLAVTMRTLGEWRSVAAALDLKEELTDVPKDARLDEIDRRISGALELLGPASGTGTAGKIRSPGRARAEHGGYPLRPAPGRTRILGGAAAPEDGGVEKTRAAHGSSRKRNRRRGATPRSSSANTTTRSSRALLA